MSRAIWIGMLLGVAISLAPGPLTAAGPRPQIEDPAGDANFANDQGIGDGSLGDFNQAGMDASAFADVLAVTFASDKKNLHVHIETESTDPPMVGEGFRVRTNPDGAGGTYCLYFEAFFPGTQNNLDAWKGHLRDACTGDVTEGEAVLGSLGAVMITIPRAGLDALKKGATLTAPQAATFIWSGSYPTGVAGPFLDTTKPGTDYKMKN